MRTFNSWATHDAIDALEYIFARRRPFPQRAPECGSVQLVRAIPADCRQVEILAVRTEAAV